MAKHILIVDDTHDILHLLRRILEDENHQVSVLDSGQGVVDFVRLNKPDVVVLDLRMPGISGITVLHELKTDPETSSVSVIAYTASIIDAETTQQMIDEDPELYAGTQVLQKPFALDELLSII